QIATASALVTRIAGAGVFQRGWHLRRSGEPGIPPSRAQADHMRPIEVIEESPQTHMAPPMMTAIRLASGRGRLWSTMYRTGYGSAAVRATSPPGMHHVRTTSST